MRFSGTANILGIETSCDETAAAVIRGTGDGAGSLSGKILSNVVHSQFDLHAEFGGVVPEIAARAHVSALDYIIEQALREADTFLGDIDLVSVTAGPGLIGGVMVGLMTAKAISASAGIPFVGVNHLEGHALTARLTDGIDYPYLLLLVSGGHSQILCVKGFGHYERWASTIDDALGEAFDKTAKLLSLPSPGGPNVEKAARDGDPNRFAFSIPLKGQDTLNFSFSGLKTAVRQQAKKLEPLSDQDVNDVCASFQHVVGKTLADRIGRAIHRFESEYPSGNHKNLVIAGGVAANQHIRSVLGDVTGEAGWEIIAPPLSLCTDNGAMIAWAGFEHYANGQTSALDISPRSRWPLDDQAEAILGHGKKGAKA